MARNKIKPTTRQERREAIAGRLKTKTKTSPRRPFKIGNGGRQTGTHKPASEFDKKMIFDKADGSYQPCYEIVCCKCPATFNKTIRTPTNAKRMPFELVSKVFIREGWKLGKSRRRDICPECQGSVTDTASAEPATTPETAPRRPRQEPPQVAQAESHGETPATKKRQPIVLPAPARAPVQRTAEKKATRTPTAPKIEIKENARMTATVSPIGDSASSGFTPNGGKCSSGAIPPRLPSRDQNRRIRRKLDDVYADSDTGEPGRYVTDWSDNKVAQELDVPLAWVKSIRVDFYGDGEENEEIAKLVADQEELRGRYDAIEKSIASLIDETARLAEQRDRVDRRLAQFTR